AAAAAAASRHDGGRSEAVGACVRRGLGRGHREAPRFSLRAQALEALAQDEMRGNLRARRGRLHRSARRARRSRRAARRLRRGRRLRVRGKGRHRLRHEAAPRSARAVERDRDTEIALHQSDRTAAPESALGQARDRRAGGVHRVDRESQAAPLTIAWSERVITHPDKILFPAVGEEPAITKGELAAYYESIAPVMLPHVAGRPVTMERYPAGIDKE